MNPHPATTTTSDTLYIGQTAFGTMDIDGGSDVVSGTSYLGYEDAATGICHRDREMDLRGRLGFSALATDGEASSRLPTERRSTPTQSPISANVEFSERCGHGNRRKLPMEHYTAV